MLKKRIAACLVIRNGIVVQSIRFSSYLPVGRPEIAAEFLNNWGIDEIIVLDINASAEKKEPNYELINKIASHCQVPLTIGGGISKIEHIDKLLANGADKISINQTARINTSFIGTAAKKFGNQCIVVSIDAIKLNENYFVYDHVNKKATNIAVIEFIKKAENEGAGEILINSVINDGLRAGFDKQLINDVCNEVSIPIIAIGGAKNGGDIYDLLKTTNVSCAAAANYFHFFEHSVIITKAESARDLPIRLDTAGKYPDHKLNVDRRLEKMSDKYLEELLFIKIEKEII